MHLRSALEIFAPGDLFKYMRLIQCNTLNCRFFVRRFEVWDVVYLGRGVQYFAALMGVMYIMRARKVIGHEDSR